MSISQAINTARTGLQINGLRAEVVSTNVANAATPGYVRRSLNVSEILLGSRSNGVQSDGISRSTNEYLTERRRLVTSDQASASVLSNTWESLSARLGNTSDGPGLFNTLSNFENALVSASTTPESTTGLASVLNASEAVANEFKDLSDLVATLRAEADREINIGVERVNNALDEIIDINASLAGLDRGTNEAAALFDQRDRALDTISEYLPIETVQRESGAIDVITKEGAQLISGTARKLEFTSSIAFGPDQTIENGALSGLTLVGSDITPGANSFTAVSSGMFGALFQLRDVDLPEFNAQLDTLASDLVSRFSNDALDPTKTAGDPGLFVDTGTAGDPGAAGRLAINAAVNPDNGGAIWRLRDGLGATSEGPPGNSDILNNLLGAFTSSEPLNIGQLQGQFSVVNAAAEFSSLTGYRQVTYEAVNSSTQTQLNTLRDAEVAETGVSIDDQMQNLLLIEQAYSANARVIQTASDMINRLMEL